LLWVDTVLNEQISQHSVGELRGTSHVELFPRSATRFCQHRGKNARYCSSRYGADRQHDGS
jgi:hypothetical protein